MGETTEQVATALVERVRRELPGRDTPLFVGLDGRSGAGKTTLAGAVADALGGDSNVTVIAGDDFYAGGSGATWDRRTAAEQAACVIDWRRQRKVLEALRIRGVAEWHPFDWESEQWDTDTVPLVADPVRATVGQVVLLEGAYSCRPELHDLLDLLVLLEVADEVRRRQLMARQGEYFRADWDARWSSAEVQYFEAVMPAANFDLVLERTA